MAVCAHDDLTSDLFGFSETESQLVEDQRSGLPPSIRNLLAVLGAKQAYAFLKKHGGVNLYIPCQVVSKSTLTKEMSAEQFKQFIALFNENLEPMKWVTMPKTDKIMQVVRNRAIREEKANGESLKSLARKYQLTSRQIQNIIKEKT